jgi:hypothetical protein
MFMNNPNDHILKTPWAVGCVVWFAAETKRASPNNDDRGVLRFSTIDRAVWSASISVAQK